MALYKQSIHSLYHQPLCIEHLQPLLQICNNILLNHFMSTHRKRKPPKVVLPRPQISEKKLYKRFVDYLPVKVKGGDGGNGLVAFSSLPCKEWAGPDGGNGGNGGHVIAVASHNVSSLARIKRDLKGNNGVPGRTRCQHGKNADHLYVNVPLGTMVKDKTTRTVLADLKKENQSYILGRGGAGGHGNHYYLSNELRAPTIAEEGGKGEERELILEMRVSAHVGLVGFPNAGKSTLLTTLSRAKPKVADYPFTTLNPHIGMVEYNDGVQVAVADIPGLIEGSHMNRGLGISFLRHIEKCLCLLYVLDMSAKDPLWHLEQLQYELEQYMQHLSKRPHAIVANKIDLPESRSNVELLRNSVKLPVIEVSGKEHWNIDSLKQEIRKLHDRFASYNSQTT